MFKLIDPPPPMKDDFISMNKMKPMQLGEIMEGHDAGTIVLRTASTSKVEVMDLSNPSECECWTDILPTVKVRLLPPGTKITLEVI